MSETKCHYPCGCDQFPDEHCACMDGHRRCSRCWAPWHPAGTPCEPSGEVSACEWCDGQDSPGEHENGCRLGPGPSEVSGGEAAEFADSRARQHLAQWQEGWLYHREDSERNAGFGHHMEQLLARLPRDGQTRDMKRSIEQMIREYEILLNALEGQAGK